MKEDEFKLSSFKWLQSGTPVLWGIDGDPRVPRPLYWDGNEIATVPKEMQMRIPQVASEVTVSPASASWRMLAIGVFIGVLSLVMLFRNWYRK